MKNLILHEALTAKVEEVGGVDAAADYYGETSATVKKALKGGALSIRIAQRIIEDAPEPEPTIITRDPEPEKPSLDLSKLEVIKERLRVPEDASPEEIIGALSEGRWKRDVVILFPTTGTVGISTMFNVVAMMRKCPWLGFQYKSQTVIQRARNILAQRFLATEADWSLWMDSDMILPFGEPGFMRDKMKVKNIPVEFARIITPDRLRRHGKSIVGGVYAQRELRSDGSSKLCIAPDLFPRGDDDKNLSNRLRNGPFNELVEVQMAATGCLMVHRQVYLDIMEANPGLAPDKEGEPWNFFGHDVGKIGEDFHFCKLAREAGHKIWLDCGVFAPHIGNFPFLP